MLDKGGFVSLQTAPLHLPQSCRKIDLQPERSAGLTKGGIGSVIVNVYGMPRIRPRMSANNEERAGGTLSGWCRPSRSVAIAMTQGDARGLISMIASALDPRRRGPIPQPASPFAEPAGPAVTNALQDIRIGTMVKGNLPDPAAYVRQILPLGFESIQPFFWQTLGGKDVRELAGEIRDAIGNADVVVSSIGMFGNPLEDGDLDRETLAGWEALIDNAHLFGTDMVTGFTGRVRGKPLPDSLPRFREVWGELARRAADKGVRIAFENCAMDGNWASGDWNIAHNPDAWELMFDELPDDNLGLEWEPCHQLVYLIDPIPQIRKWAAKIFHVHGKDATVRWDVIREHGIFGKLPFVQMRTPGFGDSDWVRVISELRLAGYRGAIDIEGWHDPVYRDALEMTGQVRALNYLKECRGGAELVPNPS